MKNTARSILGGFGASLTGAAVVIAFLFWLIYIQKPTPGPNIPLWIQRLPTLNAVCNSLSAIFLVRAVLLVKRGLKVEHKRNIFYAVFFSGVFLVSYITYYAIHGETHFLGYGTVRPIYFFILVSHILLSVIVLPLILYTLSLGLQSLWPRHRAWAKWTFPLWLYVNVTGVLIHVIFSLYSSPVV